MSGYFSSAAAAVAAAAASASLLSVGPGQSSNQLGKGWSQHHSHHGGQHQAYSQQAQQGHSQLEQTYAQMQQHDHSYQNLGQHAQHYPYSHSNGANNQHRGYFGDELNIATSQSQANYSSNSSSSNSSTATTNSNYNHNQWAMQNYQQLYAHQADPYNQHIGHSATITTAPSYIQQTAAAAASFDPSGQHQNYLQASAANNSHLQQHPQQQHHQSQPPHHNSQQHYQLMQVGPDAKQLKSDDQSFISKLEAFALSALDCNANQRQINSELTCVTSTTPISIASAQRPTPKLKTAKGRTSKVAAPKSKSAAAIDKKSMPIKAASQQRKSTPEVGKPTRASRRYSSRAGCDCPNCQELERLTKLGLQPSEMGGEAKKLLHCCHHLGCGKEYEKTSHLRAHLRWHSLERQSACRHSDCGKRFARTDELRKHMKTHHSNQLQQQHQQQHQQQQQQKVNTTTI